MNWADFRVGSRACKAGGCLCIDCRVDARTCKAGSCFRGRDLPALPRIRRRPMGVFVRAWGNGQKNEDRATQTGVV